MRTMKELAQSALDVQDACNLSGVVHMFSSVMTDLRANNPDMGTDDLNHHPISVMFSSKVASLSGCESASGFSVAYSWVNNLTKGE